MVIGAVNSEAHLRQNLETIVFNKLSRIAPEYGFELYRSKPFNPSSCFHRSTFRDKAELSIEYIDAFVMDVVRYIIEGMADYPERPITQIGFIRVVTHQEPTTLDRIFIAELSFEDEPKREIKIDAFDTPYY